MIRPSKEQQRFLVRLWNETGQKLDDLRRENLRGLPYRWQDVDALLELGDAYDGPPRLTSGLVEMQRWFMKAARRRGVMPMAAHESPSAYGVAVARENKPDEQKNSLRTAKPSHG